MSEWGTEKLFQLIAYRHDHRLPTIITSRINLPHLVTSENNPTASRIADPSIGICIEITAPNYRQYNG